MARIHTHYDNLKVARDAPPEVIRAAFKTLSQKHHPDRHGDKPEANRIFQIINGAYDVLSDPVRRRQHDEWIWRMESGSPREKAAGRNDETLPPSSAIWRRRHRHRVARAWPQELLAKLLERFDNKMRDIGRLSTRMLRKASRALHWRH